MTGKPGFGMRVVVVWLSRSVGFVLGVVLVLLLCRVTRVSAEMPTLAEKKSVILDAGHAEAEHIFSTACRRCHALPNPMTASAKPDCSKGMSDQERSRVQAYQADILRGKSLYASHCGRCHALIAPSAHTREYWSKNVCTSEECFIENLKKEEEQQVLLYLSSQAGTGEGTCCPK